MKALIVGAGPAAAAVATALAHDGRHEVVVVDIGRRLEESLEISRDRLSRATPGAWRSDDLAAVTAQPAATDGGMLPQKRSFGSDYPFADEGQLASLDVEGRANASTVSAAFGGFSNVWGAQIMPFSRSTFDTWPFGWSEIEPHYRAVLNDVPLAADVDDYARLFPLLSEQAEPLPPLDARTQAVLTRYDLNRERVRSRAVTVGRARLAFDANDCVSCGLCMTGCPWKLIYSAERTLDKLAKAEEISYRPGRLVVRVGSSDAGPWVRARDTRTGAMETLTADRVFVAAGGMGSTRLALSSLENPPAVVTMGESVQFVVPFVSRHGVGDPRDSAPTFTLNQFNILVELDKVGYTTSQVHCYPYNPAVFEALPAPLQHPALRPLTGRLLGRLTAGLGYIPSWASPRVRLDVTPAMPDQLAAVTVGSEGKVDKQVMGAVRRSLLKVAPQLDLFPILPMMRISGPAKSYHFGGSLAHSYDGSGTLPTDRVGQHAELPGVHFVDGAVLPSVPSTTFTLTVMANAHRIASEVLSAGAVSR